ncbi:hypothetical protein [uncultured Bradyrhizobium sp.]|jgi:hypothetical protein|uniref:hypothetical protein n=1 Tax=uncultured Bradyrhizobium sp. TaxID=199684 RepID=UPI002625FABB|nr:hypothetical protein [uncultured Bradyrhizobium sp.]
MTSKRQIEANRANARKSSGPKTALGKALSSRNALRHGLSCQAQVSCELRRLWSDLMVDEQPQTVAMLADAAETFRRVRAIRLPLLAKLLNEPSLEVIEHIRRLDRYNRSAQAKQKLALRQRAQFSGNGGIE